VTRGLGIQTRLYTTHTTVYTHTTAHLDLVVNQHKAALRLALSLPQQVFEVGACNALQVVWGDIACADVAIYMWR
jgi:hypothetical protein